MATSPAAVRHVRPDFDSYFPIEDYKLPAVRPQRSERDTLAVPATTGGSGSAAGGAAGESRGTVSTTRTSDDDFLTSLPFPAPLSSLRAFFQQEGEDFSPDQFLLQHQRHAVLDDLARDLRDRSRLLDEQLLRGVEADYEDFIGLGKIAAVAGAASGGGSSSGVGTKGVGIGGLARIDTDGRPPSAAASTGTGAEATTTGRQQVDDLTQSIRSVAVQVRRLERDLSMQVAAIDTALAARKQARRARRRLRLALAVARASAEIDFHLDAHAAAQAPAADAGHRGAIDGGEDGAIVAQRASTAAQTENGVSIGADRTEALQAAIEAYKGGRRALDRLLAMPAVSGANSASLDGATDARVGIQPGVYEGETQATDADAGIELEATDDAIDAAALEDMQDRLRGARSLIAKQLDLELALARNDTAAEGADDGRQDKLRLATLRAMLLDVDA